MEEKIANHAYMNERFFLENDNYSEPCEIPEKDTNHACMNERSFLEFHMARSHIEMQRSGIEMGL